MIDTDATYNAKGFTVTATPSVTSISAQGGASGLTIPSDGTSTYTIGGTGAAGDVASVAVYRSVIATIQVHSAQASDLQWELQPNLISYIDTATSEPHYYEYVGTTQSQSSHIATCAAKTMFGLKGYLVVMDSAGENTFVTANCNNQLILIGISDAANEGTWIVVNGPKTGQLLPYTQWNPGEPSGNGDVAHIITPSGNWDDESYEAPSLCEFGGTQNEHPSGKAFRGETKVVVPRKSYCDFGSGIAPDSTMRCYQHHVSARVNDPLVAIVYLFDDD
eukprot:PhM_4_TR2456/c1_g1_i1/m.64712